MDFNIENMVSIESIMLSVIIVIVLLIFNLIYNRNKRICSIRDLPSKYQNYKITGIVTSISDGDGFKLFHTPLLLSRKYTREDPKLSIRLAGIDAPEVKFYGIPDQPYALESKELLSRLILNKTVTIEIVGIDRYNRILAFVYLYKSFCMKTNINFKMLEEGMACLYIGKDGIYGDFKDHMMHLENEAKENKCGIWEKENFMTPMEYKKKTKRRNKKKE